VPLGLAAYPNANLVNQLYLESLRADGVGIAAGELRRSIIRFSSHPPKLFCSQVTAKVLSALTS
jgi:hypothetical protein